MGTVFQEGRHAGEFLVSEGMGSISRGTGTIKAGAGKLQAGSVLGQITADKTFVLVDPDATDGSQTAKAILYAGANATTDAVRATLMVRLCEVNADALVWPDGMTDAEIAAALAQLADPARFIIAR
ncbi:head decoration protein [Azospirillum melinis]|uniref:Head decoration protein n=1 Tax=Azospirillum melinis TaxID=328839 RepID=A0ABX2KPB1_9PROT|nr:head decoration protein [Azospirillum melinis]MBP2310504.1 X-X-X-Leu-X-X-Gly heptad repeat protein [Azospirillum melinis]NUB04528.1 head decoration protein [Azospirillum melinis]